MNPWSHSPTPWYAGAVSSIEYRRFATPEEAALASYPAPAEATVTQSAQADDAAGVLVSTSGYEYMVQCFRDERGWHDTGGGTMTWGWSPYPGDGPYDVGAVIASGIAPAGASRVRVRWHGYERDSAVGPAGWMVVIARVPLDELGPRFDWTDHAIEVLEWDDPPATG